MVEISVSADAPCANIEIKNRFQNAFRLMILSRTLEDKLASLYRSGKITGGCYVGRGQEALSVACGLALRPGDTFAPLIRDQAGRLAFGEPLEDSFRTYLGSRLGPARGRDGNVHRGRPREGLLAMVSHLGAMVSTCAGTLLARKLRGETGRAGLACIGEGGTSTGAFHEALNLAAVERLPLVVVVANNMYAYSTPNNRQFACEHLADRARGYGVRGWTVRGNDLAACLETLDASVGEARRGGAPQLVVATLLRQGGHGEHDDASYIDSRLRSSPEGLDCIDAAADQGTAAGWCTREDIATWRAEAVRRVDDTLTRVQREPAPDASEETWCPLSTRHLQEGLHDPATAAHPAAVNAR